MAKPVMVMRRESLAYGRNYLVFDRYGNQFAPIRGLLLSQAIQRAMECDGEIWLNGRCVQSAEAVASAKLEDNS